ncbi:MAG TPA: fused MFS/spermidine synthase [Vicinamibacterales bacterium]
MNRHSPRSLLGILAVLFFCSGMCALIYQVLWLRMLGWVFGVTVYAASTVWATFMGGLAVGSFAAGRLADRVRNPLRWFGATEALIGVTAAASPLALAGLQRAYVALYPRLPHTLAALTFARFLIALLVLIVPTALMGATLPLVVKASAFRSSALGRQLGVLYGSNAFGAIVGTLAAGLYFIPARGISSTFAIAAALNLVVGATAAALSRRAPLAQEPIDAIDSAPPTASSDRPAVLTRRQLTIVLAVFTLSGVISLALEVVWFRVLTLFLRPTVYGFAVMLATILTGIAAGSYIVTPLLGGRRRWVLVLAVLELATAVAIVLSFTPLSHINDVWRQLDPYLSRVMPDYLVFPMAGSLIAIFPTALLMGVAFPIGLHLWTTGTGGRHDEGGRLGRFYSLNVAGAIAGSLLAGFVLLPAFGSRLSLTMLAAAAFVSGSALLAVSEISARGRAIAGALALVLFAAAVQTAADPFDAFVAIRYPRQRIIWKDESVTATAVVHESGGERSLTVNGNHEASTGGAMSFVHHRIGHLGMSVHPLPRTALVVGLGGGATAGALSRHDGVDVDIVELSESVVRAAPFFEAINYGVLRRPNVHLRLDDGRNYLMLTPRRYDVITADVIHPIFAGSGNLYSAEYFRLMRNVLNPGGLVVQWVAGTEAEYKTIARTFLSVFPETTVWGDGSLLLGSMEPLRLRRSDFDAKQKIAGRADGMREMGAATFEALQASFVAGPRELGAFVGDGPVLTDDRPLTEYFLSLPRDRDIDTSALKGDVRPYVDPIDN